MTATPTGPQVCVASIDYILPFFVKHCINWPQTINEKVLHSLISYSHNTYFFCWLFIHLSSRWSLSSLRVETLIVWIGKHFSQIYYNEWSKLRFKFLQLLYPQSYVIAFSKLWIHCVTSWSDAQPSADMPNVFNSFFSPIGTGTLVLLYTVALLCDPVLMQ